MTITSVRFFFSIRLYMYNFVHVDILIIEITLPKKAFIMKLIGLICFDESLWEFDAIILR